MCSSYANAMLCAGYGNVMSGADATHCVPMPVAANATMSELADYISGRCLIEAVYGLCTYAQVIGYGSDVVCDVIKVAEVLGDTQGGPGSKDCEPFFLSLYVPSSMWWGSQGIPVL